MKIRNFEYFASKVARKFDTVIQRSLYNYNGVWFANGMYMELDGEFLYISEFSNGVPTTVLSCFVYCYNTQKDFFHELDLLVSCNCISESLANTTAEETTDTTGEYITENTDTTAEETTDTTGEDITENTEQEETENAECSRGNDVFDGCKTVKEQYFDTDTLHPNKIAKIENINHCPNQNTCCIVSPFVHCNYNYKSDICIKAHKKFLLDCNSVHKQMKAITNPNWHHVSLATLANIDFDMLDEKLQTYLSVYRDLQQTLTYMRKCNTLRTYDICIRRYIRKLNMMYAEDKITKSMMYFIESKISMQNAESGIWASEYERATGFHKSRRYNNRVDAE